MGSSLFGWSLNGFEPIWLEPKCPINLQTSMAACLICFRKVRVPVLTFARSRSPRIRLVRCVSVSVRVQSTV